tara:strand:- start:2137 stop:2574 length:438 start_codon:yes stop_codon:yes gene_type:complete
MNLFRNILLFFLIIIINISSINFFNNKASSSEIDNLDQLEICSNKRNCVFDIWHLENLDYNFKQLIEILNNTPRVKILEQNEDYIYAISTSRVFNFVDDIQIKKIKDKKSIQIKSKSRVNMFDFGVNKRRVDTLRFRLIDIYKLD